MKKIAILTPGVLPVPAVQGGAVENLIDFYLAYNDEHRLHDITIYSIYHPNVRQHPALSSPVNHYYFLDNRSLMTRSLAFIHKHFGTRYYYYDAIEYFFHWALQQIKRQDFDVVVLENRPGYALGMADHCPTLPIVAHIHTNLLSEKHVPKNYDIIRKTSKFLPISHFIKQEIESIAKPKSIKVLYNGLDTDKFKINEASPIERRQLSFAPDDFIAIFTGRLIPNKGIKELLQAFTLLAAYPDIKLMVLGSANFNDTDAVDPFMQEIQQIADKLDHRVVFTGFVPYKQIPNYLALADVAVVPSHINEAFGMSCIEACAMGLPVIATNDGGIPEALAGQKHILVDKNGDLPQQLADAILQVKNHYTDYQGNSLNPIFTKETYAKRFFEEIESIIQQ